VKREVRSDVIDDRTLDLFPDDPRPVAPPPPAPGKGVGARQAAGRPGRGGGGYLNGRTSPEVQDDPRLREFAEIGLSATWLQVASLLGYDQFVAMWRLLSQDESLRSIHNQIVVKLRPFERYERYQRNRYIETLVLSGFSYREVDMILRKKLGERLSERQGRRLVARAKAKVRAGIAGEPALMDDDEPAPHR